MRRLRIAIAQIDATVGDFEGNYLKIANAREKAKDMQADLLVLPELAIPGYPPEDLLLKPRFIEKNLEYLDRFVKTTTDIAAIIGFVDAKDDLYNAAAVISDGKLAGVYHKIYLPNYGVFDENRYFRPGNECPIFVISGVNVGVNICEDIWYEAGPATAQAFSGAEVIVNISASPYHYGRGDTRQKMLGTRAVDNTTIIVYANMAGGQDELIFDGQSLIYDERGKLIARGKQFEEDMIAADLDIESVFRTRLHDPRWRKEQNISGNWSNGKVFVSPPSEKVKKPIIPHFGKEKGFPGEIYEALVTGTRDYVNKNNFKKVVIGLSGGIDSSLVATIAVDALGKENTIGVFMPSRYTTQQSTADAQLLAKNLDIRLIEIPIEPIFQEYLDTLAPVFEGLKTDTTEENIQARIRGNLLMALSNKFGWLVLNTGNKSEMATGYTTLYGDMAGGFSVLKDVPKTLVYKLAEYRNSLAGCELIPSSVIHKVPSAELRYNQKDSDNLPPYEILDQILVAYVEEDKSMEQIIALGLPEDSVKRAIKLVDSSEYKRRQAPPGIKITPRAFGRDRRLPITNRFNELNH